MSFRLIPNSVTLDDPERRHSPNRSVISPNSVAFEADYVKVIKDTCDLTFYNYDTARLLFLTNKI